MAKTPKAENTASTGGSNNSNNNTNSNSNNNSGNQNTTVNSNGNGNNTVTVTTTGGGTNTGTSHGTVLAMNTEGNSTISLTSLFKGAASKDMKKSVSVNLAWFLGIIPLALAITFRKKIFALKNLLPKKSI